MEFFNCEMKCDLGKTHGMITIHSLRRRRSTKGIIFNIKLEKIKPGYHGIHVHEGNDLSGGCDTLGPHYNPLNTTHSGLNNPYGHYGDLGNVYADENGKIETTIQSNLLSLNDIKNRSIVLHSNKDDLGRGKNIESLKTGNSGARILCGIITE